MSDIKMNGYVYLFKTSIGVYKIGQSIRPENRLYLFQKLPFDIVMEHQFRSKKALIIEMALQSRFRDKHVRGEWYRLTDEDVTLIKTIRSCDSVGDLPKELIPKEPIQNSYLYVDMSGYEMRIKMRAIRKAAARLGLSASEYTLQAAMEKVYRDAKELPKGRHRRSSRA